jgi:hypothetical protein
VLGKLWPRLLLVLGLVMAGWPILAVTQVWGGVDIIFVALASLVVLAEMWAVAGISLACAVGARTLRRALTKSYFWSIFMLALPMVTCPFGVILVLSNLPGILADARRSRSFGGSELLLAGLLFTFSFMLQFMIGLWGIRRATFKLRHARYFYARMPWQDKPRKLQHWEKHPPVPQGLPLIWREIYLSGQTNRFVKMLNLVPWVVWLCVCSVFMVVGWAAVIGDAEDIFNSMNQLVRWAGGFVVGLMALMVGLHAAGSVSRERQQETLDHLLAIPGWRRDILWAKWVGSLAKARGIALGAMAIPLVGVIAEGISPWAVVPLVLAAVTTVACAASFGLWLSVRSRTVQRATGAWLLLVGMWVGGTFLAAQAAYMDERANQRFALAADSSPPGPLLWDRALNPALAWSELTFRFHDEYRPRYFWTESGVTARSTSCGRFCHRFWGWVCTRSWPGHSTCPRRGGLRGKDGENDQ